MSKKYMPILLRIIWCSLLLPSLLLPSLLSHSAVAQICERTAVIENLLLTAVDSTDCNDVNTTDLNAITGTLNWSNANISSLTAADLDDLSNVTEFDISFNNLSTLVSNLFIDINPSVISFANNNISAIGGSALRTSNTGIASLTIDLSSNDIEQADLGFLTNLKAYGNRLSIDLSNNSINHLVKSNLNVTPKLINLSHNDIGSQGELHFSTFESIANGGADGHDKAIDLSHNQIASLTSPFGIFYDDRWGYIYLSHNQLTHLPNTAFEALYNIKLIDLGYNNLTSFNRNSISPNDTKNNYILILDGNPLTLSGHAFQNKKLSDLYLRDANITTVVTNAFAGISNVDAIHLNNNLIDTLQPNAFFDAYGLAELYLNDNMLTAIPAGIFGQLPTLNTLDLSSNNFSTLPPESFANLSAVDIDISDNQLNELPMNLLSLHSNPSTITNFDFAGNNLTSETWEITNTSWITGANNLTLQLGHSLPEDITINITSTTGILSSNNITISKGETSSALIQWTPFTALSLMHVNPSINTMEFPTLKGYINISGIGVPSNLSALVCNRSPKLQALLIQLTNVTQCHNITITDLISITGDFDLSNMDLLELSANDLDYLLIVSSINVSNNQLKTLVNSTFLETSPGSVSVANNNISAIQSGALKTSNSPDNNVIYDLSYNAITSDTFSTQFLSPLKSSTFTQKSFDFSYNNITTLAQSFFDVYANNLNLSYNQIAAFPNDAFTGLMLAGNDLVIDLGYNQLTALPANVIENATGLAKLYLNDNQIVTVDADAFAQLTDLTTLDLSRNQIVSLPVQVFNNSIATDIDLSDNQFKLLPKNLLLSHSNPSAITNFDIAGNDLFNNSWEITDSLWQETEDGSYMLQLGHAFPNDITIAITSDAGTLSTANVTVPAGSVNATDTVLWTPQLSNVSVDIQSVADRVDIPVFGGHLDLGAVAINGICDRSEPFQALLQQQLSILDCNNIAIAYLLGLDGTLDFSNANISQLVEADLQFFNHVKQFDFTNNNLITLTNYVLQYIDPEIISFANNNISVIEANALRTSSGVNSNITYDLSHNAITSDTLASGFLNGLKSSQAPHKIFDLSHNNITNLESSYFDLFADVLNLSHNQIGNFDQYLFNNILNGGLDMALDLSHNNITATSFGTINGETFSWADLSHNQISSMSASTVRVAKDLAWLDLSYNQLTNFNPNSIGQDTSIFDGTSDVNVNLTLNLSYNPLILKANNFAELHIDDLYLDGIASVTIPANTFANIVNLTNIYLNNANLTSFSTNLFGGNTTLIGLYLANNQLTNLTAGFATQMVNLATLDLSDNQLSSLQLDTFANLTAIDIDLSGNNFTALPMNLLEIHSDPTSITSFNLADNQLLNDTWQITNVSWVEDSNDSYYLEIGHALPVDVVLPLSSSNGNLTVNNVTIAKGNTTSELVSWTALDAFSGDVHIQPATTAFQVPQLSGFLAIEPVGAATGICPRSESIRALLLTAVNATQCENVLAADLTALNGSLDWQNQNLTNLTFIDLLYLSNIDGFDLADNNITALPSDLFANLAPTDISFANNEISVVAANALFTNVVGDNDLNVNLSNNQMTADTLASGFLTASSDSQLVGGEFDLSNNQIATLVAASFAGFNPAQLHLDNNAIASIDDDVFVSATGLTQLNLTNNQLVNVTAGMFNGLSSLLSLDLSNNTLDYISNNSMVGLTALQTLNLANNQFSTLQPEAFTNLTATAIDLSGNNFTSLPMNLLALHSDPTSITSFDLTDNQLPNDTWQITNVSWVEDSSASYYLEIGHALPVDVVLSISSSNGNLTVNNVTIAKGNTTSELVSWTALDVFSGDVHIQPATTAFQVPQLSGFLAIEPVGESIGICPRTESIRSLLLTAVNATQCENVLAADLTALNGSLDWQNQNLTSLTFIDLIYLSNIDSFDFADNNITALSSDLFANVDPIDISFANNEISIIAGNALFTNVVGDNDLNVNLSNNHITADTLASGFLTASSDSQLVGGEFDLSNNQIATLVAVSFAGFNPAQLHLDNNAIASIDDDVFVAATELQILNLANNQLSTLQPEAFTNLTATDIDLSGNDFTALPMNLLELHSDPSSITSFNLTDNQLLNDTWQITNVSWVEDSNDSYYLELGHALPVDIATPISSSNGNLNATSITIVAGATTSSAVTWTALDAFSGEVHIQPATTTFQVPQLSGFIVVEQVGESTGICARSEAVRSLLLTAVNATECSNVQAADLTALNGSLDWQNQNLTSLTFIDLLYLSNIAGFDLSDNNIAALPSDLFANLAPTDISFANNEISVVAANALVTNVTGDSNLNVNLSNNQITADTLASGFLTGNSVQKLVGGTFDLSNNQIATLTAASFTDFNPAQLYLDNNAIASIDDDVFVAATELQILNLANNQLSTITAGIFNGLAATNIDLSNNNIATLPLGLLANHMSPADITLFDLSNNLITDWEITTSQWNKLSDETAQLTIAHALPQDLNVAVSSPTGTLDADTVTIAAGQTSSQIVTWSADAENLLEIIVAQDRADISLLSGFVRVNSILDRPSLSAFDNQTVVAEHTFTPIMLPIAAGGDGQLTYTLVATDSDALPGDLVFNATQRQLSGSIDTAGNYSLTYQVEDVEGDSSALIFTLQVIPNLQPTFAVDSIAYSAVENEAAAFQLPMASAGNADVVYTLSPLGDLPAGFSFNATQLSINGTSAILGTVELTFTATDTHDGDSDSLNVTIVINEQSKPEFDEAEQFSNKTMRQDDAEFALELPAASGGNDELSYSFTTNDEVGLPAGLYFNATSRMIEGAPEIFGEFNITVVVEDSDLAAINDSDTFSFILVLIEALGLESDLLETYQILVGSEISLQLPAAKGGVPSYTYALDGTLPAGLSFNVSSRTISGVTPVTSDAITLTYSVTDSDNFAYQQQMNLSVSLLAPQFLASVSDLQMQLGTLINKTLPAVTTDGQISITYSLDGLPAGVNFDPSTRLLSGGSTELGTHTITYKAIDTVQQQVEQSFDIIVTTNTALLQDIMWRQALAIASQTVSAVQQRFALVNQQQRLPYASDTNGQSANLKVSESNWIGLWLRSGSSSLSNNEDSFKWDGDSDAEQIGIDLSGKNYLIGLVSESVSTSSSFTVTGEAFDYTGDLDISDLSMTSFYGGYYQPNYNIWAISSSGSGSANLSVNVENSTSTLTSGVDYSMLAFGGQYKVTGSLDFGFESISSVALDFANQNISSISSNPASRNKFFGSIDFGHWINQSKPSNAFKFSPKLDLALRSDSGEGASSSGVETTLSLQLEYKGISFQFGNRNFSSGDFSETGQWFAFSLRPSGKAGLNFEHSQQFGANASKSAVLFSDRELSDIVSDMHQSDTVASVSKISYGWNLSDGTLQLYSEGKSSYEDSLARNVLQTKADIRWEQLGLSFDSAQGKYSWSSALTGGFIDRYINSSVGATQASTAISFSASFNF